MCLSRGRSIKRGEGDTYALVFSAGSVATPFSLAIASWNNYREKKKKEKKIENYGRITYVKLTFL